MKITTKGYYKVIQNNIEISKHYTERKAVESAINVGNAIILFPDRIIIETEVIEDNNPNQIEILNIS